MTVVITSSLDIYIPIAPYLADYFQAGEGMMKLTFLAGPLASCLIALPVGFYSDRLGRKPFLLGGTLLYAGGSLLCAISPDFALFLAGRLVLSLGMGGLGVLGGSVLADLYEGAVLARYIGIYATLFPVVFALAPIAGAYIDLFLGWRAIFYFLAAGMILVGYLIHRHLPETKDPGKEIREGIPATFGEIIKILLFNPLNQSLILAHILPISLGALFVVNAPFLYLNVFGFEPTGFAWLQAVPTCVNWLGAILYSWIVVSIGLKRAIWVGFACSTLFILFNGFFLAGVFPFSPIEIVAVIAIFKFGTPFIISSAATRLLGAEKAHKGLMVSLMHVSRNLVLASATLFSAFIATESIWDLLMPMFWVALAVNVVVWLQFRLSSPINTGGGSGA